MANNHGQSEANTITSPSLVSPVPSINEMNNNLHTSSTASTPAVGSTQQQPDSDGNLKGKRKAIKERSEVWEHFTRDIEKQKSTCNHCKKVFCSDSKANGTSSLKYHLKSCMKFSNASDPRQQELHFQHADGRHGEGNLVPWKFDQQAIRMAIARMVIIDELPFKFVDGEGFKQFMNIACPRFIMPSRWTTARDIIECHDSEKLKLK
ncbi:uncharacterized protein LOC120012158 isoform X1 [Tripterygium wilfordii]|uniref:uncharacterized protein LOC120012158 isoform X1 n=2 Tax=Tripterygium wilfordii TaxID=458696 RepID=UPI0018F7F383|nr:uncharacterized protein LOC120012158 isoform X1 [Tripterygium wilfordii]